MDSCWLNRWIFPYQLWLPEGTWPIKASPKPSIQQITNPCKIVVSPCHSERWDPLSRSGCVCLPCSRRLGLPTITAWSLWFRNPQSCTSIIIHSEISWVDTVSAFLLWWIVETCRLRKVSKHWFESVWWIVAVYPESTWFLAHIESCDAEAFDTCEIPEDVCGYHDVTCPGKAVVWANVQRDIWSLGCFESIEIR